MFGEEEIQKSVIDLAEMHRAKRDAGKLTYSAGRLCIVTPTAAPAIVTRVPRHTYFGDEQARPTPPARSRRTGRMDQAALAILRGEARRQDDRGVGFLA